MKKHPSITLVGLLGLALLLLSSGCATGPLPLEARGVTVVKADSPAIEVHRPRLLAKDGDLLLEVYILRQWKAETTADSHVDLVFLDASGRELLVDTTNFSPRSLRRSARGPQPSAYIKIRIQLPAGTAALEVRGHDGPHEQRKRDV